MREYLLRGGFLFSDSFFGSCGRVPHWRGIEDDNGRLMVLIAHNNDVSDSWQWADNPNYPADKANLGLRIGVNIAVYMLTH